MPYQWIARIALPAILLLAAALRLANCEASPPGVHIDEASNIFNANCLLHTGHDEHAKPAPLFYTRAFGDNRSALFLYLLQPFQLAGGMSICASRAASAVLGVAAVALIYFAAARLFSRPVGIIAALLLALTPWHIQHSRWAHEASIAPFLTLGAIAMLLWVRAPIAACRDARRPVPVWACAVAGLVAAVACYGYGAVRIFLPAFLLLAAAFNARVWLPALRERTSLVRIGAMGAAFLAAFVPLVVKHVTDPAINQRLRVAPVWDANDSSAARAAKAMRRYPLAWSPRFLFVQGARDPSQMPPRGFGTLHWYEAPLLAAGIVALALGWRSPNARVVMAGLLAYPLSDLLLDGQGANVLRLMPGLPFLSLAAAVGAVWIWERLTTRRARRSAAILAAVVVSASGILFAIRFFGSFNDDPVRWRIFNMDLRAAAAWLAPRMNDANAVVVSESDRWFTYAPLIVYTGYTPKEWFTNGRERATLGEPAPTAYTCVSYGKVNFIFDSSQIEPLVTKLFIPGHRILAIVRPGELGISQTARPVLVVRDPAGNIVLECYDLVAR